MYKLILLFLCSIILSASTQTIPVTVSGSDNIEYGQLATITCNWDLSDESLNIVNVQDGEELEVIWAFKGQQFVNFQLIQDDYEPVKINNAEFTGRNDITPAMNYTTSSSTLTIGNVQLTDAGDYKCIVKIKEARLRENGEYRLTQGKSSKKVGVYKIPDVSFNLDAETNGEIDIRPCYTEDDEGSTYCDRKQIGSCEIIGAYPQPKVIRLHIGNQIIEDDSSMFTVVPDSIGLYSVTHTFTPDLTGENNQQLVSCSVSDIDSTWEAPVVSTNEKATLTVLYFPTRVDVEFTEGGQTLSSPAINEGGSFSAKCVSDGNPAPDLLFFSENGNNTNILTNNTFSASDVTRDDIYIFGCNATSSDLAYPSFLKEAEQQTMTVKYLDTPEIAVEGAFDPDHKLAQEGSFVYPINKPMLLTCSANSLPPANFNWRKNEGALETTGAQLNIASAKYSDSGDYNCAAVNGNLEKTSEAIKVQVVGPCEITNIKSSIIKDNSGNSVGIQFECVVDPEVTPKCEIDWQFDEETYTNYRMINGKQVLMFDTFPQSSVGENEPSIRCNAKNSFDDSGVFKIVDAKEFLAFRVDESSAATMATIIVVIIAFVALAAAFIIYNKKKTSPPQPEATEEQDKMMA